MKGFRWKTYELVSPKLKEESGRVRFCFLSDLHGSSFGMGNERLIAAIDAHRPDGIFVGGDFMISKSPVDFKVPYALLEELGSRYPIWYALGNHEYRLMSQPENYRGDTYAPYEAALRKLGVRFLHNENDAFEVRGSRFVIYGLELEASYFQKLSAPRASLAQIQNLLDHKEADPQAYTVLLAHSPRFGDAYFDWGSDLTLAGHYHGGIWRLGEHHGLLGPQDFFFPGYCCGDFKRGGQTMIVSAGLGEHTVPVRVCNPREVLEIVITAP